MPVSKNRSKSHKKSKINQRKPHFYAAANLLQQCLSEENVNNIGHESGLFQRVRKIRPLAFLLSFVQAFSGGKQTSHLSDILRTYIYQNGESLAYKAWHTHLDKNEFSEFMLQILNELVTALSFKWLKGAAHNLLNKFDDILIQDGSSFSVHKKLESIFPGRFKKNGPAAVELHLTYSIFEQCIFKLQLSADTDSERKYLPEPATLKDKLLLADRGYYKYSYFKEVIEAGGNFIMRLTKNLSPKVVGMDMKLKEYVSQLGRKDFDVLVETGEKGKSSFVFRIVGLWNPKKNEYWYLATNLDANDYNTDLLSRLYHFRWQVELVFKQWKSHCNLKKFNTRKENIAMGLIWASLISHVLVSFVGNVIRCHNPVDELTLLNISKASLKFMMDLPQILAQGDVVQLAKWLENVEVFLLRTAKRKNIKRDQTHGALNLGLEKLPGRLK
ncbi:IS4 family transposase [Patescibacteria group bacterium]|nr:IS4 family transposase [Patescibacteria group bacterium]